MASFDPRAKLAMLSAKREILEIEADAIQSELTSLKVSRGGGNSDLVDSEGFPRADIDIFNVKLKRKRLNEINTDYKAIMKEIEEAVKLSYQTVAPPVTAPCSAASITVTAMDLDLLQPIAKLDQILAGSPAAAAGFKENDLLLKFGSVTLLSAPDGNAMPLVATAVGGSINKPIVVVVRRQGQEQLLTLTLVPKTWDGRGVLGCHLSPIVNK